MERPPYFVFAFAVVLALAVALAPEIGPGFSPDINEPPQTGLSPLRYLAAMDFFDRQGYVIYGISTVAAFLTGCLPLLVLAGAAAFGAPSRLWVITYFATTIVWALCCVIPLFCIASRATFAPVLAMLGSSAAIIYCSYAIYTTVKSADQNPLYVDGIHAPFWFWLSIPLVFNAIQFSLSISKFRQLRNPEVAPWRR